MTESVARSKFEIWEPRLAKHATNIQEVISWVHAARSFEPCDGLAYGDHGLSKAEACLAKAISDGKRIALYADYDVDGTMSCVSWIWFLEAIGYKNYVHYIPCRFREGYGLNLDAIKHLIHNEEAQLIITMDTGITANEEAAYCAQEGVTFICTDHHKIQPHKMPDCVILNPKMHPDESYQELCGAGITFVLLRKLGQRFPVKAEVWTDILGLVGMATICDVVPLNPVNHRLAKLGIAALLRSKRPILTKLLNVTSQAMSVDETDVGFRLGPRINAVGRLQHADAIIAAFTGDNHDDLVGYMESCNEERKSIQRQIVQEALEQAARFPDDPILFLGGDWHHGVVGIAASKIAETYWRPVWLFNRGDDQCKGSARSIPGFDVTDAMTAVGHLFTKFGGHAAAGGFSFSRENEDEIRLALNAYAGERKAQTPEIWQSRIQFDFGVDPDLVSLDLLGSLEGLKPFGHGFEEPIFMLAIRITNIQYYNDKESGKPRHTVIYAKCNGLNQKIMFFNEVLPLATGDAIQVLVTISKNFFRNQVSLNLIGKDWRFDTAARSGGGSYIS